MLDLDFIRKNPGFFDEIMQTRNVKPISDEIISLDNERKLMITTLQNLQKQRNEITKQVAYLKKSNYPYEEKMRISKKISVEIENVNVSLKEKDHKFSEILSSLPNIPSDDVPIGSDETQNIEIKRCDKPREFSFSPKPHYELGENLHGMDFKLAAEMSGSRFVILKNHLARLDRALASFMLDIHTKEFGYVEVLHPVLVHERAMYNVGQLPKFSDESFSTTDGFRLIPTSEVVLTNLVARKILDIRTLPLRFTAYSQCFRLEAGSAGKDTRGMMRHHQFSKVELVSITTADQSDEELERMLEVAQEVLRKLELPYRLIMLCTGDMGFSSKKTYDLEVWMPAQNTYREISSCSNCGDFQAKRMNAKYIEADKKKRFVHTLNGSALAVGRTIAAILENYQNSDGSITIPFILRKYMDNKEMIR